MSRGARDFSGFSKSEKNNQKRMSPEENPLTRGDNCNSLKEPIPKFIPAPCETIFEGSNNSYIILGRDRPNSLSSGYGGKGNTQAGSIDIVVGRMGNTRAGPKSDTNVHPSFNTDAARIYLSQKTDIDSNFGLVGDTQLEGTSGIGIKADGVRIVGRQGVKIVSGKAKNSALGAEINSKGQPIDTYTGIELIGGNDVGKNPLEPMVKAYALAETLQVMVDEIMALRGIVDQLSSIQTKVNIALANHVHPAPGTTAPALTGLAPAAEIQKMDQVNSKLYMQGIKIGNNFVMTRLTPVGKKWFGSQFNKTN